MDLKRLLAMVTLLTACASGQTAFTVSSVKPNHSGKGGEDFSISPGMLTVRNVPLSGIIAAAYGIAGHQISGPRWLGDERFDIIAKTDAPVAREEEMRPLLQALLAERFRLAQHRETKEFSGYALTIARNGPKLEPAGDSSATLPFKKANKTGGTKIAAEHLTMAQLAEILSRRLRRPVRDVTGLEGVYRVALHWAGENPAGKQAKPDKTKLNRDLPSVFTALQEQLGLRLDAEKARGEILVIDHIDRTPTAN
jgi:uncharacterized protein (TIGR03435 family)